MEKFKVGDKVKIIVERPENDGDLFFVNGMSLHLGEVVTITQKDPFGDYKVKENNWLWSRKWLEPIK